MAEALEPLTRHAFTSRDVDGMAPPGAAAAALMAPLVGVPPGDIVRVRQVHGASIVRVVPGVPVDASAAADVLIATDPARAVAVAVADCVPVLIADRKHRVVAAVHAGWRGTASGAVPAAVRAIAAAGIEPHALVAAIGPSIGPCCYQVDLPVREAFLTDTPGAAEWFVPDGPSHWKLDLWAANRHALVSAGVPHDAVHVARLCTFHHPDACHSFRRDGSAAGRMFAAIRLVRAAS